MRSGKILTILLSVAFLTVSCSGDKEGGAEGENSDSGKPSEEEVLSYSSEMINFGVYFDREGEERTITLEDDQQEFIAYVFLKFPEGMKVCNGQWKIILPEGVEVQKHYSNQEVNLSLGNIFKMGLAEQYIDPLEGGKALIHTLELKATGKLSDARITIVPGEPQKFLGITTCEEDFPKKRASSFVGVINPKE